MAVEPWQQWGLPDIRFLRNEDAQIEALKWLTRDGLVWLQHWVTPKEADS